MLKELDIPIYPQYVEGANIHDDGKKLRQYTGTIPNISLFSLLDMHLLLGKIDRLVKKIDIEGVILCPKAREYDGISLFEFGRRHCYTTQAQNLVSAAARMILGYESDEVSLLYFLYYCASAGGTRPLLDSDGGGQDSRMVGGTTRLLSELRSRIEECSNRIIRDTRVVNVCYDGDGCSSHTAATDSCLVKVTCENGAVFTASRVIMCCPPSALARIQFDPTPPPWKLSLWTRSHMGNFIKVVVMYKSCFWRSAGLSGSCVCEQTDIDRPISGVFDYCDDSGDNAALCCFVCGAAGICFAGLSPEAQKSAILGHLVHLLGPNAADEHVIDFYVMDWRHDPDGVGFGGGGCPVDVSGMGFFREHSQQLRKPLRSKSCGDVIYFAGTETALRWVGYMVLLTSLYSLYLFDSIFIYCV